MGDVPGADVGRAAAALLRELDLVDAAARRLDHEHLGPERPVSTSLHREAQHQRARSRELRAAVAAARRRASSLVEVTQSLVTEATLEGIERREWPRTDGLAIMLPGRTGEASPAEHVALARATGFISEHAKEAITIDDIARASGVGVRHLQTLFRRRHGLAPTGYLRRVRLDGVHRDLRRADPTRGATVEGAARRWQFTHLGRFATAYREQFGCVPSQTLRAQDPGDDRV